MKTGRAIGWPRRPQALLLYAMAFCGQCDRTIYVMTVSWLAIGETADLAAAGLVLVWWPLISLFTGALIGAIVDRYNRRNVLILGQLLRVGAVAWLFLAPRHDTLALHLATVVACFGAMLSGPSLQALLKSAGARTLSQVVVGAILAGLAAEILGAVAAGVLIAAWDGRAAFMACALLSGATAVFALPLRREGAIPAGKPESLPAAALTGCAAIIQNPTLLSASLGYILAWASAQMTLALLPGFARFELHLSAQAYGWIDAMWGVGGVISGTALLWWRQGGTGSKRLIAVLLLLALATAGFSAAEGLWVALVLHGLMGGIFTIGVATAEMQILRGTDAGAIGRVRGSLQAAMGATGVAVFLLPTIQGGSSARTLYVLFAVILAAATLVLLGGTHVLERRRSRRRPGGG